MSTEAQARLAINRLLEDAGWRLLPGPAGEPANVVCEHRVNADGDATGFADYLLLGDDGKAVAVLEAKRAGIDPLTAKEQTRRYAEGLRVSRVLLSNGEVHYDWDLRAGEPRRVARFPSPSDRGARERARFDAQTLAALPVDETFVAVSQDANWLRYTADERAAVRRNRDIRELRDYQLAAVHALQKAALAGRSRFLFEMATGTGKTLVSAAVAKLFLRSGNASRILFLVDRLELEVQAHGDFTAYLGEDGIRTVIFKENRNEWKQAEVVVTTIQSLATAERYRTEFTPDDFQLIISDEAHRTISGNNRVIFEYFTGAKLGLTATPRDFIKGVNTEHLRENDPRALEERLLRDTCTTFGCPDGKPTFRYSLHDAVNHVPPYLVNPVSLDARTEVTTRLLSDEGYSVTRPPEDDSGVETELTFGRRDFERKFFSPETNATFVAAFLDRAFRDPITGEVGKTILFAVSRAHATKLTAALNDEAARRWPAEYGAGSSFAVQVTSGIPGAQRMTLEFKHNNLNGRSRWRSAEFPDYATSRTRVCVTVGMMTTGYDCRDILNVVLARPIFAPADFIQIKGRGTRLFIFKYDATGGRIEKHKTGFALFDFFATCEYFEKDFNYDDAIELPKGPAQGILGPLPEPTRPMTFTQTSPDPIATIEETPIGKEGMRIDREMFRERYAADILESARHSPALARAVSDKDVDAMETAFLARTADSSLVEKLREAFAVDRKPLLREILAVVFGLTEKIEGREDIAERRFREFAQAYPELQKRPGEMRRLFFSLLLSEECSRLMLAKNFAKLQVARPEVHAALRICGPEALAGAVEFILSKMPEAERASLMGN